METDSMGGAFVALDMDLQAPLFRVGIIGGTEYADLPDQGPPPKHFRQTLLTIQRAVEFFKAGQCVAVAHLGDVLAAENAAAGTTESALESFNHARGGHGAATWHFTPGVCDVRNFGPGGHGAALSPARSASKHPYYAFFPASRWRVLVLDCMDPQSDGGSGIGSAQLTWIGAQLSVASAEGERVILVSHRGLVGGSALSNASAVQERLAAHPGVVVAVLSLGDGDGAFETDGVGVHHISPAAAISCDANDDPFGWLEVFDDKLHLHMPGKPPDPVRVPGGWPTYDLVLPVGGALSSAAGLDAGFFGFFIWLSFFMLQTVGRAMAVPLSPLTRLLSGPADGDADGGDPEALGEALGAVAASDGAHGADTAEAGGVPMAAPVTRTAQGASPAEATEGAQAGHGIQPPSTEYVSSSGAAGEGSDGDAGVVV